MTDIADGSFVNIAPEPATGMGICRLVAQLDGEKVVRLDANVGFSHRGIEKILEGVNTTQALVWCDKLCRGVPFAGGYAFVLAVEKLAGIEVPKRAGQIVKRSGARCGRFDHDGESGAGYGQHGGGGDCRQSVPKN